MDVAQTLGKYEIRGTLGRGAMGVVHDGWDPLIARRVAIKSVPLPEKPDPETAEEIARFRREAQAAGRLTHPNIVAVYDYGETADLAYIVMEYVDGPTLKSLLDKKERFQLDGIAKIMGDLLAGLQFSHERGVVHRDIKPGNIMLTSAGQAKIADFGIARIEMSSMTQAGTMLGTPAYMSPEQFRGEAADARTDVYSAGVVLYQLLTGERPFEGGLTTIMHKVLNVEPPAPSELTGTVPHSLDAVVRKAMAKRPQDRFPSATAFADALRAAIAAPAGAAENTDDDEATLVRAAKPAAAPARNQPASAKPPSKPAPPPEPRASRLPLIGGIAVVLLAVAAGAGWYLTRPGETPPAQTVRIAETTLPPTTGLHAPPPTTNTPQTQTPVQPPEAKLQPPESVKLQPAEPVQMQPTEPPVAPPRAQGSSEPSPPTPTTTTNAANPPPPPSAEPTVDKPAAPTEPPPPPTTAASPPKPVDQTPVRLTQGPPVALTQSLPAEPAHPPPAEPTQAPPPEKKIETATIASLAMLQQIGDVLLAARCSLADASLQDSGGFSVSGFSDAATADSLRHEVGALPGTPQVAWHIRTVDPMLCAALSLLRPISPLASGPRPGVALTLAGSRVLHEDEPILPRITMPDFAGELRVDYLVHDGTLAHLYPTAADPQAGWVAQPSHHFSAGERIALGDRAKGKPYWPSGPPFGTDMIIVVASSVPLRIGDRPNGEEKGNTYLADLGRAIEQARAAGARVSGTLLLVDAIPKSK